MVIFQQKCPLDFMESVSKIIMNLMGQKQVPRLRELMHIQIRILRIRLCENREEEKGESILIIIIIEPKSTERFSIIECRKTKITLINHQIDYSASLKLELNQYVDNCLITFDTRLNMAQEIMINYMP